MLWKGLLEISFGGIHFTGSTYVFSTIWLAVGKDIRKYALHLQIVGETGGNDFISAHVSADTEALVTALVREAFEYQRQKCSAAASITGKRKFLQPKVQSKRSCAFGFFVADPPSI
jgi:1-pyrroline-5-carboxylate dehydrogenase